jgi:CRP/FNR family cyclic AMP-dependent transcriptional regulator
VLLAQVPLFSLVDPDHLAQIAARVAIRRYARGEVIFHQNDPGSTLHVIKSGQVKIASSSDDGDEVLLAFLGDNDFFGELSLLDGKPRSATATAMAATQTLTLERVDFLEVISKNSDAVGASRVSVNRQLRLFQDKGVLRLSRQLITLTRPQELRQLI